MGFGRCFCQLRPVDDSEEANYIVLMLQNEHSSRDADFKMVS